MRRGGSGGGQERGVGADLGSDLLDYLQSLKPRNPAKPQKRHARKSVGHPDPRTLQKVKKIREVKKIVYRNNFNGDTFSIEAPPNLLRTKRIVKERFLRYGISFLQWQELLRTFFWYL